MNSRVRSFFKIFGAAAFLILLVTQWNRSFVFYEPLDRIPTGGIRVAPIKDTPLHRERLKSVLTYYGEDWKTNSSGQVLIRRSLSRDHDLLANCTEKADNAEWMQNLANEIHR